MNQAGSKELRRKRSLAVLLGACVLTGCQPGGAGSITVDRKDPSIQSLKSFEDVKRSKKTKTRKTTAGSTNPSRNGSR